MKTQIIGLVSGLIVVVNIIPYAIRTYQKKISPNLTSWTLWSVIGLALLLTYRSSGAKANVWPAIFGFTNPTLIAILIWRRQGNWKKPKLIEIFCFIFCLASFGVWLGVHGSKELSTYALYLAMIADVCAAIPTLILVWKQPWKDRPFAWVFYAIGYGLTIFAITEHTFANYILPIYMFFGPISVALPLILYRLRSRTPLSQWI